MPKLTLNGKEVEFEQGMTILQVCEQEGIEIPRFCYHEKLEIAGNCRMCLVEVQPGPPKPAASCAMPASDGMTVRTDSEMVRKARAGVMEFILINHPLDCPTCDQGGECDLQDQAVVYGTGVSRYCEAKRIVEDKYMGPLIKTNMTRCINCTRCIRFAESVAGVPVLGQVGRGEHAEVTTYVEQAIASELSGNLVDLCPVGALTSKPYAFKARPWELRHTETIDVMDAVGSNIRVDTRGNAVMRILPRLNEDINEEWISDKTRYACDGLNRQRLDRPYIKNADGKFEPVSWEKALSVVAEKMSSLLGEQMAALAGNLSCVESMYSLKKLMNSVGCNNIDCRQDGAQIPADDRAGYIFNTTIAGIEKADLILLVGCNPRTEAPLVNARILKTYLNRRYEGGLKVYNIGNPHDLTYPVEELGSDPSILEQIARNKHKVRAEIEAAKNPMIIVGAGALARPDGADIHATARFLATHTPIIQDGWNGFNILHYAAARVGGLDVGFVPQGDNGKDIAGIIESIDTGDIKFLYLLGVDEIDTDYFGDAFVVYQGHHGDIGALRADVILPSTAYTEKDATYVNLEGRPQRAYRAVFPPNEAKEDWKIIRALSENLGKALPFDSLDELRDCIAADVPHLAAIDEIQSHDWTASGKILRGVKISSEIFDETILNFYMTDPISRVSKTMAECSRVFLHEASMNKGKEQAA